jgi:hypothetical protein
LSIVAGKNFKINLTTELARASTPACVRKFWRSCTISGTEAFLRAPINSL